MNVYFLHQSTLQLTRNDFVHGAHEVQFAHTSKINSKRPNTIKSTVYKLIAIILLLVARIFFHSINQNAACLHLHSQTPQRISFDIANIIIFTRARASA